MSDDAIVLQGVRKTFGTKVAVSDLDLTVPSRSLYGFIGPNGAGKTTTIRMIMSILFPDQGTIEILGHGSALDAKDRIGYLPEERGVYRKMKVASFLRYIGALKGLGGAQLKNDVNAWLERVGLAEVASKPCEELSKGMQQKIQFVASILHKPDLLILDEPFSGLDPVNMRLLRDLIQEQFDGGATVIFSTHVMYQAEQLCDHIVMIHDGEKMLDDTLDSIRDRHDPRVVQLEPIDPEADVAPLRALGPVEDVVKTNGHYDVMLREGSHLPTVMKDIASLVAPSRLEIHRPTLEDVFIDIVSGADAGDAVSSHELRASLRTDASALSLNASSKEP